jgi:nucleotide-binding universal stress UspA family protein
MKTLETETHVTVKNVLFATDFSKYSNAALPYALAVAHQYGSMLFATHVLSEESYLFTVPEGWASVREHEQRIDANRLEAQLRGVPHQILSTVGDITDVIFRLIHDHDIDLLVLGTHGRSGFPKLLMGSVAEKIFRQSPVPVLTVGPHVVRGEKSVAEFNRIVFATDFSDESLAALPYAFSLAQEHQAHLSLLHVVGKSTSGTVDMDAEAEFAVRRLQEIAPPDPDVWFQPEYFVEFGNVEEQIRIFASKHGADLIVLGVRPNTGNMTAVTHLSNTMTHRIVAYATCPVLTVRG